MGAINLRFYLFACLTCYVFFSTSIRADQQNDIENILSLINQSQGNKAFEFAQTGLIEYEGDVEFDYAYGLAAQAAHKYHHAIFAFERVIKQLPSFHGARSALAVNYFAIGNLNAARMEFEQLVNIGQSNQFPKIADFMAAIDRKLNQYHGNFEHTLQMGLGFDTNANSGIDSEYIDLPQLGKVTLFESSQEIEDYFVQTQWRTQFIQPITMKSNWYAVGKFKFLDYQDSPEMSRLYGDLMSGWQQKTGNYSYNLSGFYRPVWLDSDKYIDYYGASAEFSFSKDNYQKFGAVVTLAQQNYQQDDLDRNQVIAHLWYEKQVRHITHRWTVNAGIEESANNDFKHLGRSYWGLSYRVAARVDAARSLSAQVDYIASDYEDKHPLFFAQRNDELWKVTVNYHQDFGVRWTWLSKVLFLNNSSNLSLYEYDRAVVNSSLQYKF